jgi:glycosyltransferase involved in cell wall biosynthesis
VRSTTGLYGPERLLLSMLEPMPVEGFGIEVAALYRPGAGPGASNPLAEEIRRRGGTALDVPDRMRLPVPAIVQVARHLRRESVPLVHAHDFKADLVALIAARWAGAVPVATMHLHTRTSRRLRAYRALDLRVLRHFARVVTVSSAARRDLIRDGLAPDRVVVIPGCVDAAALARAGAAPAETRARLALGARSPIVAAVARLTGQKGQRDLLHAAGRVLARWPRAAFLLVGEGPDRPALEALARALGLGEAVVFLGYQREVAGILRMSDVVVLPSLDEGLPVALLEALALGRPVVATDVGGVAELIRDRETGRLVPPRDAERLAGAISELLAGPAEAMRLGERGRTRVARDFSPATMARRMAALYREVLS